MGKTKEGKERYADGCMYAWLAACMAGKLNGWLGGHGWTDGWTRMDGWTHG